MGTTEPIREERALKEFRDYYKNVKPHTRNYCLIILGLNTALRISDLLHLKWKDVYYVELGKFRSHINLTEQKTKKRKTICINDKAEEALTILKGEDKPIAEHYLFTKSTTREKPLSRSQAYRIITEAAHKTLFSEHISCHSLRKTFGYHAWKQGIQPALLMEIFNHSSYKITKRYLGINQDEQDKIYRAIQL